MEELTVLPQTIAGFKGRGGKAKRGGRDREG